MANNSLYRQAISIIFLIGYMFSSCTQEYIISVPSQLVVEGWIDHDGFPVVQLTKTVPVDRTYKDLSTIEECVIKWAKVTVSDGENEVILTGKVDNNYFPPYIYTTGQMRGKAGKKYTLTVEYEHFYAESETTIPYPAEIDSFSVVPVGTDSLYQLTACFKDCPRTTDYYAFFIETPHGYYRFSSNGVLADEARDSFLCVPVLKPVDMFAKNPNEYTPYFKKGERAGIKFVRMDSLGYQFWKSFEETRSLSRISFFSITENMKSNIRGGLGYWIGYGANYYAIPIAQ